VKKLAAFLRKIAACPTAREMFKGMSSAEVVPILVRRSIRKGPKQFVYRSWLAWIAERLRDVEWRGLKVPCLCRERFCFMGATPADFKHLGLAVLKAWRAQR
jgi:hypothetical protein